MTGEPLVRWDWVSQHLNLVGQRLIEHVELTLIAVVLGLLISFPLAVISYRNRQVYGAVATVTGILYTIPSLALFAIVGAYTGYLSTTTAEIGLVSYTLLILIRNIVAGLRGVPEDVRESARGMGFSNSQMLWLVELPLALPVIMAGVRLATVTTIGLVTVTAVLGLGGFGHFILDGLRTFFTTETLLGAVLSVVLAIAADALLLLLQRLLTPWSRRARAA
ncbi:MAG: ABC transporter permease [Actinomycetota bacterium]|nr:ABC transporter permease [Actinomycetota bacterium]